MFIWYIYIMVFNLLKKEDPVRKELDPKITQANKVYDRARDIIDGLDMDTLISYDKVQFQETLFPLIISP